jgi:glycosyltransferase involved in cell wall biosynthesis
MDRCEALAAAMESKFRVYGIEIASQSGEYQWVPSGDGTRFHKQTLFQERALEEIPVLHKFWRLALALISLSTKHVFMVNYNQGEIFLSAVVMRLLRRKVILMFDSKFDDKPRVIWREVLKVGMLLPYQGALVGGSRHEGYLRFLGFRRRPIAIGHATVGLESLLQPGGHAVAPGGPRFSERYFVVVARFIPEKDLTSLIAAYARYRELAQERSRELHICGDGPLEDPLRRQIADLKITGVALHGFLQRPGVARVLAGGLALILPSIVETWGLVVNEALAFALPVLATDQVGARDLLVRTGVNGYIFEPGNIEGLAHLMLRVSYDESEWRRLVEGSRRLRKFADTERFVEGVATLLERKV